MAGTTNGIAEVTCTSFGVSQSVAIGIGSSVGGITLTATPGKIPADGFSSSTISARIVDNSNAEVAAGTSVTFKTTLGKFWDGSQEIKVVTTSSYLLGDNVAISLIAGEISGTALVTCIRGGVSQANNVENGDLPAATIKLTVDPEKIPADGYSASVILAELTDSGGNPVGNGTQVTFTTTLGTFSNGTQTVTLSVSNGAGSVLVSLIAGTTPGIAQVVCSSNGVTQITAVQIGDLPAAAIELSADPSMLYADGSSQSVISAYLIDSTGQPVAKGTIVSFNTTMGTFQNNDVNFQTTTLDETGIATATLTAGTTAGIATVTCTSSGVSQSININIVKLQYEIVLSANPTIIWADGFSQSVISAYLTDNNGQPVAQGTVVSFHTTLGTFQNGDVNFTTTTIGDTGIATATLTAGTTTGIATVTCTTLGGSKSITIKIVKLQYETEPNNEMAEADWIIFGDAYLAQLSSPYEQDWYVYTTTQSGSISINFIATAIPEGAGCDGTTTVGTYRIDVRDTQNNVLMSYQNIDCTLDNGIWETGIQNPGTYYIVVYCPRLPDNGHYLSTPYYISAFKPTNIQCAPSIQANGQNRFLSVNSATPVAITVSMEAGDQNGYSADWWLVYSTPWGNYSLTFYGWTEGIFSLAQFPLFSFSSTGSFYQYLYPGKYVFYFGVDISPNWVLDSPLYYDWVIVQVSP
ncbi:MAG: invasin domain 3-containing protein [Desulfatirhabdiaceae bacterium]